MHKWSDIICRKEIVEIHANLRTYYLTIYLQSMIKHLNLFTYKFRNKYLITGIIMTVCILYTLSIVFAIVELSNGDCATPSVTTASGSAAPKGKLCPGDLIFEETFDSFDLSVWKHENTLAGGGNWEFQWYTNNRSVSYVEDGILHIKPLLLSEHVGDPNFIYSGHLDINGGSPADECTNPAFYGCIRDGNANTALNPVVSARIRTVDSFNYKYGKFEARARNPAGDWLWPAIWLLPRWNQYSFWPSSGEIDVMESRGNRNYISNNVNIGTEQVGSTLHWGPNPTHNEYTQTHYEKQNPKGFNTDYHLYQFEWTPDQMIFSIDNQVIGKVKPPAGGFWEMSGLKDMDNPWRGGTKMAPFDQQFYIIVNLACGGITYFPDNAQNPGGKPWSNTSPHASKDFWEGRNEWLPTWKRDSNATHFLIDYVKVWAL